MVDAIGSFDVFRAVRVLDSTQAANTQIGRGVVPAAEPNLQFNDAFDLPTRDVLGANTESQRIGAVPPVARAVASDTTDFFRPFGPVLTANTTDERGITLQIDPRARTEIVDEAVSRRQAFSTDAVEESTGLAPRAFLEAPGGSQDVQFLSRPNLLNVQGFEPVSEEDAAEVPGFGLEAPGSRPSIVASGIGLSFDVLEPLETDLGQPFLQGPQPRDPNTGAGRLPETTVARDGFVDFARLITSDEVAGSIGILPGRQDNAADRTGAFPAAGANDLIAPPPPFGTNGDAQVRAQETGVNPTFTTEERANDVATPLTVNGDQAQFVPQPLTQDQEFQNELRQRFADLSPEERESIGQQRLTPFTSIVEGGFPLIGAAVDRSA